MRVARFNQQSGLIILNNFHRSSCFGGDDRTSRKHCFNDDTPKGFRRSRTMNDQIDFDEKRENIAAKPGEVNPVSDTEVSRKALQLIQIYAILARKKGISNDQ